MAIPANAVDIGDPTRKSDYDALYNNAILANTGGTPGGAQSIPGDKEFEGDIGKGRAPTDNLDIYVPTGNVVIKAETAGTDNNSSMRLINDAQEWRIQNRGANADRFVIFDITSGNYLPFQIAVGAVSNTLFLDSTGVGIKTASPDETLQVVGSAKIGDDNTNYIKVESNGDVNFTGTAGFYPRRISQAGVPANGVGATQIDVGELLIWRDSDNDEIWLVYNDTDAGVVTEQLT